MHSLATLLLTALGSLAQQGGGLPAGLVPLDTMQSVAVAAPNAAYAERPLTVELWVRLRDPQHYNIPIAHELKSSGTHWELFSWPGSGFLTAYVPGCDPDHVRSEAVITDGAWHFVAFVLEESAARLYLDGAEVASTAVARRANMPREPGQLVVGSLVARELSCDGEIAEVRLSRSVRDGRKVPHTPLPADADTIALWRFDEADAEGRFLDRSPNGNDAVRAPAVRTLDRIDVTTMTAQEAARFDMRSGPPGGRSLAFPPVEVDLAATRAALREALAALKLPSLSAAGDTRDGVLQDWEEWYAELQRQLSGQEPLPRGAAEQVLDPQALVYPSDGDPLGVVLRRADALLSRLRAAQPGADGLARLGRDLAALRATCEGVPVSDPQARKPYFLAACALLRQIAFANPLLDFDRILFVARGNYLGSRLTGSTTTADVYGQHFATQYYGFNSIPGGGLYVVEGYKAEPRVTNVLANSPVERGRLRGRRLEPGAFLAPDLSFDGREILFAYTENREHEWIWSPQTTFHLFRVNVDGSHLVQLTDSACDDFDPCWLPNGRIAFISERRGGYIRCFALLHVPSHVLHSMRADGTDLYPLSYYETSEWQPSVNNDGMLVYTRWDYTDRENCLGSNFWICFPDGRDPRAPHGNYPYPWHTFEDNTRGDSRFGRPYVELNIRAIPGSPRYIMTAAPHHGEAFGSLVRLDLNVPDDGFMSQLRRITPYAPFPETETPARSQYPYGTPWPLSEDFTLCNWWENLYLLDRFGNRVLLCENALVFGGETNYDMRLIDPIPLRPRPRPPIIPTQTSQGERADPAQPPAGRWGRSLDLPGPGRGSGDPRHQQRPAQPLATIRLLNVYDSDQPFPPGTRIKWLRVTQNILKLNPWMGVPMIGYQNENTPRIPLGIVPVEEDGSAYFEAPVERELVFQALDENHMAVQSMRSCAFVHPGEQLTCQGCHEGPLRSPRATGTPLALRRAPSKLEPEVGPVEPITYYRLVQPVFERSCIPCHQQQGGPVDMSYEALEPYAFYFAGGMSGTTTKPIHGGARTIPGRFGARYCRLGRALLDDNHRGKVSTEDFRRVVLWLDSNSQRLGAFDDEQGQMRGEVVWPTLDVDPTDPQGLKPLPRPGQ